MNEQRQQAYLQFLIEVLQVTADSNGNSQRIYPLLTNNLDKLDDVLVEILCCWGTNALRDAKADEAKSIARNIFLFSNIIKQFPLGKKASNMEIAIIGYELVLKVYTFEAFPQQWAMTQNNLGEAFRMRIRGERAENLETAIKAYKEAFKIYTFEAFPQQWAMTQNNLGEAFRIRIRGERAENLEIAIKAYRDSLKVYTFEAFLYYWAKTQNHLGSAYGNRIKGVRAENLEIAIVAYKEALRVRTFEAFPYEWAMTQTNLAIAYVNRIRGERAENLEAAIVTYREVLKVYTFEAFPQQWAMTQTNLANAYIFRIRGERAENLELAISACQEALKVYTFDAFPYEWAATQTNLSDIYRNRIRGERAENLELAISTCQEALKVCTFDAFPYEWASTENLLGNAYLERIRGERAENLELAIAAYQEALRVRKFDAFPQDWAMTQMNLASAYIYRIRGERADNLERAIAAYQEALKVYTFEAFPQDWAMTQNNLGEAYRNRIRGERADNLEMAIAAYRQALIVRTFDAFPYDWAATQNNLAAAYSTRIIGERAENLEGAIASYQEALKIYTFEAFPYERARTQMNLGLVYKDRIRGNIADNLEKAIATYQKTLNIFTFDAFPYEWAMTQNNLGNIYLNRIKEERAENLEVAISCYQNALKVRTFDTFPELWARTQNNLANAYFNRIRGERSENLEAAITCNQKGLKVYTFEAFPYEWAMTQNNLGGVYLERIRGERAENLEVTISCYQNALKVKTFDAFPQDHAETLFNLGIAYRNANQFTLSYNIFDSAITTVESLRSEIVSGEESKRKQAEYFNQVYNYIVEVCLELGYITEAIEYVERSKTRNLVEQILERDSKTIFPPDVVTQLEKYRDEIATGQYQIQNGKAEPQVLAQKLQQLRQQRNELQNRYLSVGYNFKFDSFRATLDEHTAIIEWYILNDKILAFIIKPTGEVTVWQSQPEDREALENWLNQYLQNYGEQKDEWRNSLGEALKKLASILHIDEILAQIPNHCDQLILIPHRFLHLFPLHALPVSSQKNQDSPCLLDLFANGVSYAPSCQLLQQVQHRKRPDFQSLFAVQNPTEDLLFTDLEVENILSYFPSHQVLPKKQATKAALSQAAPQLKQASYLHFSCHGSFNLNSPQNSFLLLADAYISPIPAHANPEIYLKVSETAAIDLNKCLTLGNLFERNERGDLIFDFSQSRLVVLSACETGWIDFNNTSDEYIGLPSGFLYAGSSSVVSSLWTVNDLSTSLLMIKFIQILKNATDMSVPLAMNQAQRWLRDASVKDLLEWSKKSQLNQHLQQEIQDVLEIYNLEEKRFSSPFHWAAFCTIGQ